MKTRSWIALAIIPLALSLTGCSSEDGPRERAAPVYSTVISPGPGPLVQRKEVQEEAPVQSTGVINTSVTSASGVGQYSEGYRMGLLSKFSVKGMVQKTGEGQLLVGRDSTMLDETYPCGEDGRQTCRRVINPWSFSMPSRDARAMSQFAGEYIWVKYLQSTIKSPFYDTDYLISQIGTIDRSSDIESCADPSAQGGKSEGFRMGRIVKVSRKGLLNKTGEVTMQVGNTGNQFHHMSIQDHMFNCVTKVLKSAQRVKVYYEESWFRVPISADTNYSISKIEPIRDI